jgi:hypothetical protein
VRYWPIACLGVGATFHVLVLTGLLPFFTAVVLEELGRLDAATELIGLYPRLPEWLGAFVVPGIPLAMIVQAIGTGVLRMRGELPARSKLDRVAAYAYWACWAGIFIHGLYSFDIAIPPMVALVALYALIITPIPGFAVSTLPVIALLRVRAERRTRLGAFQ